MKVGLIKKENKQEDIDIHDDKLKVKGAYILFFSIEQEKYIHVGKQGEVKFKAGSYVYIGSAYNAGGLKARLARHCCINNNKHWHFDYIRPFVQINEIKAYVEGQECALVEKYTKEYNYKSFHKGLGSSDCKQCQSHFLYGGLSPFSDSFYK